ncbi:MAG TPA: adenylate/guanylate cyclase domain-containing protein [Anaerolineales bacterium]|nr:adenylate/guanylate cyclase domain-containing protein [Anaerolineales bacterium]
MTLNSYLPQDRQRALACGEILPDRALGSALFADISGFTPLTEALRETLGARRGVEELSKHLGSVYNALIAQIEKFGGSVIGFAGDAITCWFDDTHGPAAPRAMGSGIALQAAMLSFTAITLPNGSTTALTLKVTIASGPARRFVVGDPTINYLDTLAGATVARLAMAEHLAKPGEIIIDQETMSILQLPASESRSAETGECFFVIDPAAVPIEQYSIQGDPAAGRLPVQLDANLLKQWILPTVVERESTGHALFLTELRPTTALFVRFMGIDYDNDVEAREKLDRLISQTQRVLERHGGILLELTIGDKGSYFYGSFGASHVHEDDARRAVRASLELRQFFEDFAFLDSIQFGLSSGTMRVGAYGGKTRQSFGALGDDVNLAARLMTIAAQGEILISGRVRKTVAEEFMVEARPPMAIKGKAEPLPVFAVLGGQRQRAIRLQEPTYTLPMIGRRSELSLLEEKLALVLQGYGQIMGITAEAGMGKSRLVAEGIRLARRSKLTGYGGACQSNGINTPYLAWQAIWNAFFDLDPSLPFRKQVRSLEGELEDRIPEHMDALPLLATVLGLPLPDNDFTRALQPKDRKTILETMLVKCLEFSAREAAEDGGGLLLVLEDLHWIDPISFDLLELVARTIENLPILILLTYRPMNAEELDNTLTRLEALHHFTQIKLTELNAAETEQAIRSKLSNLFPERAGGVPPHLIESITSRAQGNPFYVEELLNYLHDRGIDPRDAAALEALDLPTSLHSLILSRIDQLTTSQQLSLKVASIIGRIFRFDDLHNYYPKSGTSEQLKADLHDLERLDLTPLESPEPELTYLFKHLVTHEVGYESLSYATRVELHGLYARYLESTYPGRIDQLAPQLAYHFERAQIQDKACFYLSKSGEQAAASFANDEALAYFTRALNLTPPKGLRGRFEILLNRERVYDLLGKRTEQRQDLTELARLADQFVDAPFLRAKIATRQARLGIDVGDYAAAKSSAQAAIQEIETDAQLRTQAPDLLVDALWLEARAMFYAGQAGAAKPQLERALALSQTYHYVRGEYNALAQLGLWYWYNGDNESAVELLERSLGLIRQAGDIRRELDMLINLGIVAKDMYRFEESLAYYEHAQKIAKRIGDRSGEASLLNNMGRAGFVSGDFVNAISYCARAAGLAAEVSDPFVQGLALYNQSEAYRNLGQYQPARDAAEESLKLLGSAGYRLGEADALENLAQIEFSLGERQHALELAGQALEIGREIAARRVEVSAMIRIGLMSLEMGQIEHAEEVFSKAKGIEEAHKETVPMFELQAGLAAAALARGDSKSVEAALSLVQDLAGEILQEPPTDQSHILPLRLYLTCILVMRTAGDPRSAQMIARSFAELQTRCEKISDVSLRPGYLGIPEHKAISEFANNAATQS